MKDIKWVWIARMILLVAGILLILNSILSTGRTGLGLLNIVEIVSNSGDDDVISGETPEQSGETQAGQEDFTVADLKQNMENLGTGTTELMILGIGYIAFSTLAALIGFLCALFSNRADKSSVTMKFVIDLALLEAAMFILLYYTHMLRPNAIGGLIFDVMLTGALFLGAGWMKRFAEAHPQRIYAVEKH